jgi:hypothetical protein
MRDSTQTVARLIELSSEYVELASTHLKRNWDISTASQLRGFERFHEFREALRIQFFFPELPPRWRKTLLDLRRAKLDYDSAREPYREPLTHKDVTAAGEDLSSSHRRFQEAMVEVKRRLLGLLTPVQQEILRKVYLSTESSSQDERQ